MVSLYRQLCARVVLLASLSLLLVVVPTLALAQGPPNGKGPHAKGHILVKFSDDATQDDAVAAMGAVHAQGVHALGSLRVHQVDLPAGADESAAVEQISSRPGVEFAELDMLVRAGQTPNDPGYGSQWHLGNVACPQAWAITSGSTNVVVAILDSGCDPTHPDLVPNYVAGWNFVDGNNNTADVQGHGTAVAGTVGAAGNNGIGIASVSWSSKIMPVRIAYNSNGEAYASWSTVAQGMQWAVDHGAKIENCSYVGLAGSSTIQSAAQYVVSHGGLFVACAGNDGVNPGFAANPNIIIASGTDQNSAFCSFSDYGNFVTVAAPAYYIYTTCSGGGYGNWVGTSFAAPIVCGVLALEYAANPNLTNTQAYNVLIQSTDDLGAAGWDPYFGYGKVNAYKAVSMAAGITAPPPPSVAITNPTGGTTLSGTASVSTSVTDSATVTKVELYVDGALYSTMTSAPYTASWNTKAAANGSHSLVSKAYDSAGNTGQSNPVSVTVSNTADTTAPTVAITSPANGSTVGQKFTANVTASDNVGVTSIKFYVDGALAATSTTSSLSATINTRKWNSGSHTLSATASDAAGNTATTTITVNH